MTHLNVHEAKTHLSGILARVQGGESFIIARNGRPVARLEPIKPARVTQRKLGCARSKLRLKGDWNAPLPARVLAAFAR
jgi:prevent-host-death family protein